MSSHLLPWLACSLITSPAGGETDDQFKQRVLKDGARKFQSAMWQVHFACTEDSILASVVAWQNSIFVCAVGSR